MYHVSAVWGQLEQAIHAERTLAGMHRAQRQGTRSGVPIGRPRVAVDSEQLLSMVGSEIHSLSQQARSIGLNRETLRRRMAELIARTVSSDNRSVIHLALTDKGREVLLRWEESRAEIVGNVLGRRLFDPEADDPVRRQAAATARLLAGGDGLAAGRVSLPIAKPLKGTK